MKPWEQAYDLTPDEKFSAQDKKLGLPAGTTKAQLLVESGMKGDAVSKAGARGFAQVMPTTQATLEKRAGRKFDPTNLDDSLTMHEMVMKENLGRFKNIPDALKAYNNGWNPEKWTNPETAAYVPKIEAKRAMLESTTTVSTNKKPWEQDYEAVTVPVSQPSNAQTKSVGPQVSTGGQVALGAMQGMRDMVDGAAYLLPKGLSAVSSLGGLAPNPVSKFLTSEADRVSAMNASGDKNFKALTGDSNEANISRIAGNIASSLIPGTGQLAASNKASQLWSAGGAANKLKSVLAAAGLGSAQGAVVNTRTNDDPLLQNAAGGAAGGVFGSAVAPIAKTTAKGLGAAIDPFFPGGIDRITGKTIANFANKPNLTPKPTTVPGATQTLAESTGDPGLAQLQRILQSANKEFASDLSNVRLDNNAAMLKALQGIAGDDAAKAATLAARESTSGPLYKEAIDSTVNVSPNLDSLLENPYIADAMKRARKITQGQNMPFGNLKAAPDKILESPVLGANGRPITEVISGKPAEITGAALHNIKMSLDDMIKDVNSGIGNTEKRVISGLKDRFTKEIEQAIPVYGQARSSFRELSEPINQQQAGQALIDKFTSGLTDGLNNPTIRAESFARALQNPQSLIKQATGQKNIDDISGLFNLEQVGSLNSIRDLLSSVSRVEKAGGVAGSKTAQLGAGQNMLREVAGGINMPTMSDLPVASAITRPLNWLFKSQDPRILQRLGEANLDPNLGIELASKYLKPKQPSQTGAAMQRALQASGAMGGAAILAE